jgi:hypothetical protein
MAHRKSGVLGESRQKSQDVRREHTNNPAPENRYCETYRNIIPVATHRRAAHDAFAPGRISRIGRTTGVQGSGEFAKGWRVVLGAFIGIGGGFASLYFYSAGLFIKPLATE